MIDEAATFDSFGYHSHQLSKGSGKKVVAVCNICGKRRTLQMQKYRDICQACAGHTSAAAATKASVVAASKRNLKARKFKICSSCHKRRRITSFHKSKCTVDGRSYRCRDCQRRDQKRMVKADPERHQETMRRGRANWLKNNPTALFKLVSKQARFFGHNWELTLEQFQTLRTRPCFYCGDELPKKGSGLDRLDCKTKKGYSIDNVVPCCTDCNRLRGDRLTPAETLVAVRAVQAFRYTNWLEAVSPYVNLCGV